MAYTKYSLTPANNTAAPPDGAPEGMLPSAVNDTMRDMMAQIRDVGDGIRGGTYTMTAPIITGGTINGATIGATTASTGKFTAVTNSALTSGRVTYAGTAGVLQDDADFTFNGTTVTMANDASISGLTVGKGASGVSRNTVVGAGALGANTTGNQNVAIGYTALAANTTASENTAIGDGSLSTTTTGEQNVAVGRLALFSTTTGSFNTALGKSALQSNTTASNNTAVGYQAGYSNTTGTIITAIGRQALYNNTTGTDNTALSYAMVSNTTGSYNTGLGNGALQSNTTASNNTAVGYQAGYSNTTGTPNVFVGYQAGYANTTGGGNVVVGYQAYDAATTAGGSTIIGNRAGGSITTGQYNTIIGADAGGALTTGTSNCFIGATGAVASGEVMTTGSKNVIVGSYTGNMGGLDIRTASNYIVLSDGDGNPRFQYSGTQWNVPAYNSNTIPETAFNVAMRIRSANAGGLYVENDSWGGPFAININTVNSGSSDNRNMRFQVGSTTVGTIISSSTATAYNTSSDYRLKENIAQMQNALGIVNQLKPVTYTWKIDGSAGQGFIAHELQSVVPDCVTGEKDAVDEDGKPVYQGIDTSFLVATLAASIQELKAIVDAQAERIAVLEAK